MLRQYSWPGNVRELRNVIERASIICNQEMIGTEHLGLSEQGGSSAPRIGEPLSLEELEKAHITAVMATSATLDQAAKTLGIDTSTLYRKRKQYNL
ncbi:Alginate biosynthesis transcriptional regulatory protein AlgB [compost metagenome]